MTLTPFLIQSLTLELVLIVSASLSFWYLVLVLWMDFPIWKKNSQKIGKKNIAEIYVCSERINISTTQKRSWCIIRNSSSLHNHLLSGDIRKSGDSPWYTWRTLRTLYYLGIHVDSRRDRTLFGVTLLLNQMLLIDETHCLHFSLLILVYVHLIPFIDTVRNKKKTYKK